MVYGTDPFKRLVLIVFICEQPVKRATGSSDSGNDGVSKAIDFRGTLFNVLKSVKIKETNLS
jgi:hypothetical protein